MNEPKNIEDRLMDMFMDLDKDGLHAAIIVLTVEDHNELSKEFRASSEKDGMVIVYNGIPIALTLRFESSHIITQETIDIIKSYKRSNKVDEE